MGVLGFRFRVLGFGGFCLGFGRRSFPLKAFLGIVEGLGFRAKFFFFFYRGSIRSWRNDIGSSRMSSWRA